MILDSSALIDFLIGNEKGVKVAAVARGHRPRLVCSVVLAELSRWCHHSGLNADAAFAKVFNSGFEVALPNRRIEKRAGELCAEINRGRVRHVQKVSLADCFVAATAEYYGLTLVATDPDFEEFRQERIVFR